MVSEPKVLHLSADTDIATALKEAGTNCDTVTIQAGDEIFVIEVVSSHLQDAGDRDNPDSILNLIGLFESTTPSVNNCWI